MTIPYPDMTAVAKEWQEVVERKPLNVFKMLFHSPNMAPGYFSLAEGILRSNTLPGPLRELVILRVGNLYDAPYELFHHERLARAAGLSEAGISGARLGADAEGLTDEERSLITWTDSIVNNHELVGDERRDAVARFGYKGLMDIVMTVGFYQLVCNYLRTFEIVIER
ncbi:carboxymuconolactone decarboxylase family protein [Cupriavidus sp. BIC8F]|uniref:carboxymuconolactone decarboxylase family protein n=1 Tax=Cupriavidus sp. BIC8F TaxID=3079014 RepID=UPI002916F724|nr:carboxymuconolactone decarboxylase family protein [Cupriavidus sp. BIC8F]